MKFIPDDPGTQADVPFIEDARAEDGWKGQETSQSVEQLRAKISAEIGRLGGTVTSFMRGEFEVAEQRRVGAEIRYQVVNPSGQAFEGRIDVAALPFRDPYNGNRQHAKYKQTLANRKEATLRMALFNVHDALQSTRILQDLSPGYAALVPWLIAGPSEETLGQMWFGGQPALPAPDSEGDIVDAELREVDSE